jgi:hypothetical protein
LVHVVEPALLVQPAPSAGSAVPVSTVGASTPLVLPPAEALSRQLPPVEAQTPVGLMNVAVDNEIFVGRTAALARLDGLFSGRGGPAEPVVVHGASGVGKSALAAHWAVTRAGRHTPIWWISADSRDSIDAGLAALALAVQPDLQPDLLPDLPADSGAPDARVRPPQVLRERAIDWLAEHTGWLLILDDVKTQADVEPLLARATSGRILITTRPGEGWDDVAVPLRLDVLDPGEAIEMVTRIIGGEGRLDVIAIGQICSRVGYLPQAVEQAGAYLAKTGMSAREYLQLPVVSGSG